MILTRPFKTLMGDAIAHSSRSDIPVQSLRHHIAGVAQRAVEFASLIGIEREALMCALWHDLGKLTSEFQYKLKVNPSIKADHKGFGALWAYEQMLWDIAFVIAGHHHGMPDSADLKNKCTAESPDSWNGMSNYKELQRNVKDLHPDELFPSSAPDSGRIAKDLLAADLRTRLLYSCLVDADYLDTEAHYDSSKRVGVKFPELVDLATRFQQDQNQLISKPATHPEQSKLFKLRTEIYEQAVQAGCSERGVYSLTVPTGGGKSRAALGFAFQHAEQHKNIQRVIVALPYTSILDQLANEYESIFGENNFLLHYTGWQSKSSDESSEETTEDKAMILAAENWDSPLILTTTVQLFDSLFSNRPSDCRKIHRIANSIIILDEVQTLPLKYLEPICDTLGRLVRDYGTTVLLSTATQPALDRVPSFKGNKIVEIVDEPAKNYEILKRVDYQVEIEQPWSWQKVANRLLESESGMVIVNTKKHALELFELVKLVDTGALHLSTYMCGAHRRQVIDEIRNRLGNRRSCRVIATQLVEAGVDLDFPLVMRAVGPLDRVVQAAGRCNREGKLGYAGGKVIVFKPEDDAKPGGAYATGAGKFEVFIRSYRFHPDDPATFPAYFRSLFQDVGLVGLDADDVQGDRRRLNFETVAKKFHLIDDGATQTIYVGYGGERHRWEGSPAKQMIEQITGSSCEQRRSLYRRLQPYSVQVFANQVPKLQAQGLIQEDAGSARMSWWGKYDDFVGIATGELSPDNLIV